MLANLPLEILVHILFYVPVPWRFASVQLACSILRHAVQGCAEDEGSLTEAAALSLHYYQFGIFCDYARLERTGHLHNLCIYIAAFIGAFVQLYGAPLIWMSFARCT